MAKTLEILIKARDEASAKLRNLTGLTEAQTASLAAAAPVIGAAGAAYIGLLKASADLTMAWQENTIAVGDLSRALDITTEEASGLIELAGDMGIPLNTLEMAFKSMATNGVEPSAEGLIDVKHQLEAAKDPTERLALATKLLGRSAVDLIPVFENLTDDQLRKYIDTMYEGQIVTEEQYQLALRQRDAIDGVTDAWGAVKLQIGEFIATPLTPMLERLNELLSGQITYLEAIRDLFESIGFGSGGASQVENWMGSNRWTGEGFANGGAFDVGGPVGIDRSLVAFRASAGERVTVSPSGGGDERLYRELKETRRALDRLAQAIPAAVRDAVERTL